MDTPMQAGKNVICFKNTIALAFSTGWYYCSRCGVTAATDVGTVMISHVLFILRDGPLSVGKEDSSLCLPLRTERARTVYATCVAVCSSLMIGVRGPEGLLSRGVHPDR